MSDKEKNDEKMRAYLYKANETPQIFVGKKAIEAAKRSGWCDSPGKAAEKAK